MEGEYSSLSNPQVALVNHLQGCLVQMSSVSSRTLGRIIGVATRGSCDGEGTTMEPADSFLTSLVLWQSLASRESQRIRRPMPVQFKVTEACRTV